MANLDNNSSLHRFTSVMCGKTRANFNFWERNLQYTGNLQLTVASSQILTFPAFFLVSHHFKLSVSCWSNYTTHLKTLKNLVTQAQ